MRRRIVAGIAVAAAGGTLAVAAPGDLTLVSRGSDGSAGGQPVDAVALSADGRMVAFTSAGQLTATPSAGVRQLYVRDRLSGSVVVASASAAGAAANQDVDAIAGGDPQFALSGDGRYAVFATAATNLGPADGNAGGRDVFRKDLRTGAVALVSAASGGAAANGAVGGDADVSYDGSRVVFTSGGATNLFGGDGNGQSDVVLRDLAAGTTTLVARSSAGAASAGATAHPAISADGRAVAFEAPGTTDLVPDTSPATDVLVRDLAAGATAAASDTGPAGGGGALPDISGDGRYVVFDTPQRLDPAADPADATPDVYRRDRLTGAVTLVSAKSGADGRGEAGGTLGRVSADGTRVAFRSTSTDLVPPDGNGAVADVYVRTIPARLTQRASERPGGGQGGNPADTPALSNDGAAAAFTYSDLGQTVPLLGGDANARADAFLKELAPTDGEGPRLLLAGPPDGVQTGESKVTVAGQASDPSGVAVVAVNGRPVALAPDGSFATDVTLGVGQNPLTVTATDGAGRVTTIGRAATRTAAGPAPGTAPARALKATARRSGRRVLVRFALTGAGAVRLQLVSRTEQKKPRRVVVRAVGRPLARRLQPGVRQVALTVPALKPGRYQVRISVTSAGGVSLATVGLRVAPVTRPATTRAARTR